MVDAALAAVSARLDRPAPGWTRAARRVQPGCGRPCLLRFAAQAGASRETRPTLAKDTTLSGEPATPHTRSSHPDTTASAASTTQISLTDERPVGHLAIFPPVLEADAL